MRPNKNLRRRLERSLGTTWRHEKRLKSPVTTLGLYDQLTEGYASTILVSAADLRSLIVRCNGSYAVACY